MRPRRLALSFPLLAAAIAIGAVPASAGPAPDFAWAWVTVRNPGTTTALPASDRGNSSGGVNTYLRNGPGRWTVTLPGLGVAGGVPFVTPFRTDRWCDPGAQNGSGASVIFSVTCVDENGVERDTKFSLVWVNGDVGSDPMGHFWADHPGTTSYVVDPFYSYNATGADNKVKVLGTGSWRVRFNGIGDNGGILHLGGTASRSACKVESYGSNVGGALLGTVACYDETGAPMDTRFYTAYMREVGFKGDGGTRVAYAFAKKPTTASYSPPSGRSYNSTGDPITIDRASRGKYRVEFGGQGRGGAAVVTAFGTNANRCVISSIRNNGNPQRVQVKCVDENGDLDDTKFLISWVK